MAEMRSSIAETKSSIRGLEFQMGQLAETRSSMRSLETHIWKLVALLASRAPRSLPSTMEVNPKETCKAITLRSGLNYEGPTRSEKKQPVDKEAEDQDQQA